MISDDPDFPQLALPVRRNRRQCGNIGGRDAGTLARNTLIPGVPAPVDRFPGASRPRAPPIFASVLTARGLGGHLMATNKVKQAQEIQKRNPSGKVKPGHSMAPLGFTNVVVTRNGGADDLKVEDAF
jgi:hypothetical protein